MEYRFMGKTGVKLSALGFGSFLTLGVKNAEESSRELIKMAYDNGINLFDTADSYGVADENGIKGQAEEMLGKIFSDYRRSSLFIVTKFFFEMGYMPTDRGLSAKHVKESCEASLKRLKTDYIDAFLCHRADPDTPIEETVWAMEDLIRQGKILYWGFSEWTPEQVKAAQKAAREYGCRPMRLSQPRYSLLTRKTENEIFPLTAEEGIGNVSFSPLAHGVLSGKYKPGVAPPADSRAGQDDINGFLKSAFYKEDYLERIQKLGMIAERIGCTTAQLAIAWCLLRPELTSVITGASRASQLESNIKALEVKIDDQAKKEIEDLFPISISAV